jgi:hypothetical protein
MTATRTRTAFAFISSYRGESDYSYRPTGDRWRVNHANPGQLYDMFPERPAPADVMADWHAHRVAELADMVRWTAERGLAADLRAIYPDVADSEVSS